MASARKLSWYTSSDSRILGFFFIFFALSVIFFARLWLVGDGVAYYAWLRSILFDHDIQFLNELTTFNITKSAFALDPIVATGLTPNTFSIGPALAWSIAVLPLHTLWTWIQPNTLFSGYEPRYLATISLFSILVILSGLVVCYVIARKKVSPSLALLVVFLLWLASPLPQYLYDEMQYAHGFSLLFVSLFILCWIQKRKDFTNKHAVVLGFLGGCMMLMRWQDALFLIIPCIDGFLSASKKTLARFTITNIVLFLTAFLVFLPQLIAWKALYGQWILIPQGNGFMEFGSLLGSMRIIDFLFSPNHGLLYCHPLFLVGFVGLLLGLRKENKKEQSLIIAFLIVFSLQIIINASVGDWAIYHSFGVRRMIDCLPIIGYGIALLFQKLQLEKTQKEIKWLKTICILLIIFNGLYWIQYRTIIDHGGPVNWLLIINNIPRMPWLVLDVLRQGTFFQLMRLSFLYGFLYLFLVMGMLVLVLPSFKKLLLPKKGS